MGLKASALQKNATSMKEQATNWEKRFANYISDKEIVSHLISIFSSEVITFIKKRLLHAYHLYGLP